MVDTMHHPRRDADEEALQAALQESMQPDFLAQILQSESQIRPPPTLMLSSAVSTNTLTDTIETPDDLADEIEKDVDRTDDEYEELDDEDYDHPPLLDMTDFVLLQILYKLDEESLCQCLYVCKRLHHIAKTDSIFEMICRRIYPIQCRRLRQSHHLALRKFPTWFSMFANRPRVRYHGFYWYKTVYYKKPELNMWTEIAPGTVLQVVYYRYFAFQRDGSVLYTMSFKPPFQAGLILQQGMKEVYRGQFEVNRDEVDVTIPTSHSVVKFRFQLDETIDEYRRGRNVRMILQQHYFFTEPDQSGWVEHLNTFEEHVDFRRYWDL